MSGRPLRPQRPSQHSVCPNRKRMVNTAVVSKVDIVRGPPPQARPVNGSGDRARLRKSPLSPEVAGGFASPRSTIAKLEIASTATQQVTMMIIFKSSQQ